MAVQQTRAFVQEMKSVKLLFGLLFGLFFSCEQHKNIKNADEAIKINPFTLTIQTYNHAEQLFKGVSKYVLTESNLEIIKVSFNGKESILYSKKLIPNKSLLEISKINIETLNEFYDNVQIIPTSGDEMKIELKKQEKIKEVHLHNYYNEQIGFLISLVNEITPKEYKIIYNNTLQQTSIN
jgi:hypothetical protein